MKKRNRYLCTSILEIEPKKHTVMGVTALKRKDRRNKTIANNRVAGIKQLTKKPTYRNVDVEAIKAEFAAKVAN